MVKKLVNRQLKRGYPKHIEDGTQEDYRCAQDVGLDELLRAVTSSVKRDVKAFIRQI